ncbi:MAG: PEP-CTERM sorting domain-containing protein [Gammaproteobacteria bacterium]|nr:PEP-CTERM sorting domain-containing protein [Gammaproteobacteria bacterium]
MFKKHFTASATLAALLAFSASTAHAYQIFFGEDLNNSSSTPLSSIPNASGAETNFLSNLIGVGTETFESIALFTSSPLTLTFPGAGTAELTGGNGSVRSSSPGTASAGRYSIPSASSSNYWEVSAGGAGNFTINFSNPIAAFGFYGVDIGDFGGQLTLNLSNGDNLTVPNTVGSSGSTDGSVLFYGLIAQNNAEQFTSVAFNTTTGQGDIFAFDNFTIGSPEQVNSNIPEPASLALFGLGLAGLGFTRRRKRA